MNSRSLVTLASRTCTRLAGLLLAALVPATLLALPASAIAQDTPVVVRINPATVQVPAGQVVEVSIEVAEARELYGADVLLSFDPAVVEVVDADPSLADIQVAQGAFFDPGFTLRNIADNAAGSVQFALTQLNPSQPKSGNGILAVIKLRGKESSRSTALTINRAEVAQRNGNKLAVTTTSGQVQVVTTTTAGPTATSFPTQAAGTPLATSTPMPTAAATNTPVPQATPAETAAASPTLLPTAAPTNTRPASTETQAGQTPASEATPTVTTQQPAATPTEVVVAEQATVAPAAATSVAAEDAPASPDQADAVSSEPATPTAAAVAAAVPEDQQTVAQPIEDVQALAANDNGIDPGLLWVAGGLLLVAAGVVLVVLLMRRRPA